MLSLQPQTGGQVRIEIISNGAKESYEIPDQLGRELWKQLVEAKKSGNPKRDVIMAFEAGQGLVLNLAQIGYLYVQTQGNEQTGAQTESGENAFDLDQSKTAE